jgi:hypothetical protein
MKTYWGVELQLQAFLILVLDGGEWLASRSGSFTPGKEPQYPSRMSVGRFQSQSGRGGTENKSNSMEQSYWKN